MFCSPGNTRFTKGTFVTEHHEDVVHYLYRALGSNSIPFEGNALVHFDSNPDMASPPRLKYSEVFNRERVLNCITSESWIMPLLVARHITKVFWFKPPWSPQFFDGIYEFTIGRCPRDGTIKVSCKENYFVCDGYFCPEEKLLDRIPMKFVVLTVGISSNFNFLMSMIHSFTRETSSEPKRPNEAKRKLKSAQSERTKGLSSFVSLMAESDWILDFDLAFFASQDPIKLALGTDENFQLYRKVYVNNPVDAEDEALERHMIAKKAEFDGMRDVYEQYFSHKPRSRHMPPNVEENFANLIGVIDENKLDWRVIHDHGVSMGDSWLPHHPSSDPQISYLLSGMERILSTVRRQPLLCTIGRSAVCEYCVPEKADKIQYELLSRIKSLFPKVQKVIFD